MVGQGTTDLDRESQTLRFRKRLYFQIRQEMSINEVWNQGRQICSQELYHLATSQVSVVQFNQVFSLIIYVLFYWIKINTNRQKDEQTDKFSFVFM